MPSRPAKRLDRARYGPGGASPLRPRRAALRRARVPLADRVRRRHRRDQTTPDGGVSGEPPQALVAGDRRELDAGQRPPPSLGFPDFATKNTTRVGGADPITDAAGVALAVFPARTRRPAPQGRRAGRRARLAPGHGRGRADGPAGPRAAAALGRRRPALGLAPGDRHAQAVGSDAAGGGQVIAVGETAKVPATAASRGSRRGARPGRARRRRRPLPVRRARASRRDAVMVVSSDEAAFGVPAARLRREDRRPRPVRQQGLASPSRRAGAIQTHAQPRIYVLGPRVGRRPQGGRRAEEARDRRPHRRRRTRWTTRSPSPATPTGTFGWGVVDPGHGLVFASGRRPLDGPAASALASSGTYGPLLLLDQRRAAPQGRCGPTSSTSSPGTGTTRCAGSTIAAGSWVTRAAISLGVQSQIDSLLEIVAGPDKYAMSPAEHPQRLRSDHHVSVDDVRQLMGASTPHFALPDPRPARQAHRRARRRRPGPGAWPSRRWRGSRVSPSTARPAARATTACTP